MLYFEQTINHMKFNPSILCLLLLFGVYSNSNAQKNKPRVTIDHVAIFVADLQKEATFYRDIMQLDTLAEPFHDNKHAWFSIGNGISMHLIQGADQPKEYFKNHHTCFSVPSLTDFTKRLQDLKLAFEDVSGNINAITTRIDGVHQIWLKDPEGYWLEVNDAKH
jgi:lactoylglutathione lyase